MTRTKAKPTHATYDVEAVRAAARGRWPEILHRLAGVSLDFLDGRHHPCPKCGGTDRFRLIDADAGACLCGKCFATGNGDGFATVQWLLGCKFHEALTRVAEHLGIPASQANGRAAGGKKAKADPAAHLEFLPWDDQTTQQANLWAVLHKPGVTVEAVRQAGGQVARYRRQYRVLALPIRGADFAQAGAKPVGWTLYNLCGGTLPVFHGHGKPIEQAKIKTTSGSGPGWIGTVDRLAAAATVWKVEGPSDVLALLAAGLPPDQAVITNAFGAGEVLAKLPHLLAPLAGKRVNLIHDCDFAGQWGSAVDAMGQEKRDGGAVQQCRSLAAVAASVHNVQLPYPVVPDHGPDLRDWLNSGRTFAELAGIAGRTPAVEKPTGPLAGPAPIEADKDPHRLARVNLERYAQLTGGGTIKFWRDEVYLWKQNRYRRIGHAEFSSRVNETCKIEFDRINLERQSKRDTELKAVDHVTSHVVNNVIRATASMRTISDSIELGTWLPDKSRRNWLAMQNGILDIDAIFADSDDYLHSHTADWFSMVCLPYDFVPEAECPKWLAFLDRTLESDPDRIALLQEWAGYLLTPSTDHQKFLILEGEGGNGKSVFLAGIQAMVGLDNCAHVPLESFSDRFSLSTTMGKLLNLSADMGEIDAAAQGRLNSLTSGDVMQFDRKGIPPIECIPTARLMFATNNRPRFSDRSSGVWRRMIVVPWLVKITKEERILGMDKSAWWERSGELPGILWWALQGLDRLRTHGEFTHSALADEAVREYQIETNPAREFLTEFVEPCEVAMGRVYSSLLYQLYRHWCEQSGYRPLGDRGFFKEVKRVHPVCERKRSDFKDNMGNRVRPYFYDRMRFTVDDICGKPVDDPKLF